MDVKITDNDEMECKAEFSGYIFLPLARKEEFEKELASLIDDYAI